MKQTEVEMEMAATIQEVAEEGRNDLTWWNSHVKTVSYNAAYGMLWKTHKNDDRQILSKRRMFLESNQVEKYVGGLPDMIQGSVMSSKPKTMQAKNKRKLDNNSSDNNTQQQQPPKKQNVTRAYSVGYSEKKEYAGTLPLCNKFKFYQNGPCTVKCAKLQESWSLE
nr:hypothetical protein [Tanacetum cinerariifolium]